MTTYDYLMGRKQPAVGNVAENAAQANQALAGGAQPATPPVAAPAPTPATPAKDEKDVKESDNDFKARKEATAKVINEDVVGTQRIANPASHIVGQPRPYTTLPNPAPPTPRQRTYEDMINALYPEMQQQKQQEEEERLRKKRKRESIISAIGDGISALANLGATSRYATPFDVSSNTMSKRTQERYDKIKADREKRRDAYRAAVARARELDMAQQREDAKLEEARQLKAKEAQWEREKFERSLAQKNDELDRLYGYRYAGLDQKERQFQKKMEEEWRKAQLRANTQRYSADHRSSGRGGGSGNPQTRYTLYNPHTGQTVGFPNEASWMSAYAEWYGGDLGEPLHDTQTSTSTHTDSRGKTSTTETKREVGTTAAQIGDAQRRAKEKAKTRNKQPAKQKQTSGSSNKKGGWASGLKL